MPRYDRSYDYGLRGYRQATASRPLMDRARGGRYDRDLDREDLWNRMPNRVTARYNMDYVDPSREPEYPRNFNAFTGDREDRIGDFRYYWKPYQTIGGTRTHRGAAAPIGYDMGYNITRYDRGYGPGR